ncbi:hypothetical protein K470DRAFT_270510 [Piedraia hortae CBS 480.64]|uniref:Cyclase n=1 Tax=Piedraia hortae CBS 480.64 TaxID=1314780 RepID=A0A6A7C142_9PEZI|nr:hypothetical protein K470DRAFT_270510 [Piedraia hortae CBS 480.64]
MASVPNFDSLPAVKNMPEGCAWGVFDKDGQKDVYGTLNHLTPAVVKSAYSELQTGVSVSLNWPLNAIHKPGFGRKPAEHRIINFRDSKETPLAGFDDELDINTQSSSQWDSLVHFHHQPSESAYNGAKPTVEDLKKSKVSEKALPTIDHWHVRGGLVARGVLVDYKRYAEEEGIEYDPCSDHNISVEVIEDVVKKQGVELRAGDVLIVRMGFTDALDGRSAEEQAKSMSAHQACGIRGGKAMAKWIWDSRFAAVAGDMLALEQMPPRNEDGSLGKLQDLPLHQYMLGLFGCPIGELWDLSRLAKTCKELRRYSFLLTSAPLNMPNLVASPPNALALF